MLFETKYFNVTKKSDWLRKKCQPRRIWRKRKVWESRWFLSLSWIRWHTFTYAMWFQMMQKSIKLLCIFVERHTILKRHNEVYLGFFFSDGKSVSSMLKFYNEQQSFPNQVTEWYAISDNFVIQKFQ